jgi:hypothetical protein
MVPAGRGIDPGELIPATGAGRKTRENTDNMRGRTGVLSGDRRWLGLATELRDVESLPWLPAPLPRPRLLLISFTTNYGENNLSRFRTLPASKQVGICLHLAALAALAGDAQLATRLRHRAANEAAKD